MEPTKEKSALKEEARSLRKKVNRVEESRSMTFIKVFLVIYTMLITLEVLMTSTWSQEHSP